MSDAADDLDRTWVPDVDAPATPPQLPKASKPSKPGGLGDLERLIGGRWYAVLGALAVVVAIALFVKLAYDEGWLHISPAARCISGALFGLLLLGAAEFLRKRLNAWTAFGGYAAGLGSIYVSVYAAWRLYDLLPPAWCFVLLAATAVLGIGIGLRSRLAAVSIVALLGGYAAPLLMHDAPSTDWVYPVYLMVLAGIGLGVTWLGGRGFHAVRVVVWLGTMLLGAPWAGWSDADLYGKIAFLLVAWAMLQGELIVSSRRGVWSGVGTAGRFFEGLALAGSMLLSAWLGLLGTGAVHDANLGATGPIVPEYLPTLIACVAAAGAAMLACGSPTVFLDRPRRAAERLGSVLALQAASLGAVALALALSGPAEAIAWLALALGAMLAAWRTNLLGLRLFALGLLLIGSGRLAFYDAWHASMGLGTVDLWGLHLTAWTALMLVACALWLVASRLALPAAAPHVLRILCGVLAGVLLVGGTAYHDNDPRSQILLWTGLLAVFAALRPLVRGARPDLVATLLLGAPLVLWIFTECTDLWPTVASPLMFAGFQTALALVAVWAGMSWWVRREGGTGTAFALLALIFALVLFFADTSLEAGRIVRREFADQTAQRAAVSMWWGVFAVGLLAAGFMLKRAWSRHAGLALLGIAGVKVVAYDLAGVGQAWRIASFLALGLLMLGVAVVYAKVNKPRPADPTNAP
ncbi:MAG: hypothetical protein HBSAPP03_26410 [Phycisphaerae bacterium]|nr:MAG: hypothetical protein HBSAPP03_26410 [Phycisphaerae bacterium]